MIPAELFCSHTIGFAQVATGEFVVAHRIPIRLISHAQFDGIEAHFIRQGVDGTFDGESTDRLAWSAHECVRDTIHVGDQLADPVGIHGVQVTRRKTELFRKMVVCGLRGDALMDESGEFAGRIRPDCHALL